MRVGTTYVEYVCVHRINRLTDIFGCNEGINKGCTSGIDDGLWEGHGNDIDEVSEREIDTIELGETFGCVEDWKSCWADGIEVWDLKWGDDETDDAKCTGNTVLISGKFLKDEVADNSSKASSLIDPLGCLQWTLWSNDNVDIMTQ